MELPVYATLTLPSGKVIQLPILEGVHGPKVLDIRSLYANAGYFTYDPGFTSTGSCESGITFIDGEEGILAYRGYRIQDLAEHSNFLESAYLLLYGELPTTEEQKKFCFHITHHSMVHEQMRSFFQGFRRDAHPMAIMVGVVGALSAFYHDSLDIFDPEQRERASYRLVAKMPTLAAMAYKYAVGQPFVYPDNALGYSENLLNMMFQVPTEPCQIHPIVAKALDLILLLHADHEQNASTSTVRLAGSSGANPFACISSGIAALWGPSHGGANEAVLQMLYRIEHTKNIPHFIQRAKDKEDPFKLMGFGHRVYRNYDPRAQILRRTCHQVLEHLGVHDPLLDIALELERVALEDEYFVSRKLYPNVDFYSGIILKAMGIPTSMFTVLFAVARTVGWVSQWKEMVEDPTQKIGRPRQLYKGPSLRPYVPIHERNQG